MKIPKGRITTYKEIGKAMHTRAYRVIGQALRVNPFAPGVPCHRVVASDGTIGGFMGQKTGRAIQKKIKLLKKEDICISNNKIQHFDKVIFRFLS